MSYRGGKNGSGVYQAIINLMPPHGTYIEAFLGAGAIMRNKRPAEFNIGVEIDAAARRLWKDCKIPNFELRLDAIDYLENLAADLPKLWRYKPDADRDFLVYCAPPYLMETRSKKARIYNHEFHSIEEHTELLKILRRLPCYVMISGYESELYNRLLHDWRKVQFQGVTRGGPRIETVWLNFAEPAELHDYSFLGSDRRERQDIKRQKDRWIEKLRKMPAQRRYAMFAALEEYRSTAGKDAGEIPSGPPTAIRPPAEKS